MARPLVSVILPTHNRAVLLRRAITSVLAQTLTDLELIVVDDASTDATADAVRSFNDPRLRYLRLPENRRAAAARNVGIREARAELVAFQDDDDIWLVQKMEKQVKALMAAPPDVGLNICGHITLAASGCAYRGGPRDFGAIRFDAGFPGGCALIATPGWVVRKHYLEQAGLFDERMKAFDDWELALRLSDLCRFEHLDEPLFVQDRIAGGGMWFNKFNFSNDLQVVASRHGSRWASQPRVLAREGYRIGRIEAIYGSTSVAEHWLGQTLRLQPWHMRARVYLALNRAGRGPLQKVIEAVRAVTRLPRRLRRGN